MSDLLFVVVERSEAGETVLGVFSSLEMARAQLPPSSSGRLENYRVEAHVVDQPVEEATPWQIALGLEGEVVSAAPAVLCNCEDDDRHFHANSFIERGGERLNVVVMARSPGRAIAAAREYGAWLMENGVWGEDEVAVEPIFAGD